MGIYHGDISWGYITKLNMIFGYRTSWCFSLWTKRLVNATRFRKLQQKLRRNSRVQRCSEPGTAKSSGSSWFSRDCHKIHIFWPPAFGETDSRLSQKKLAYLSIGWWFGCHFLHFPINIGNLIIPNDELIFFRGVQPNHQPAKYWSWHFWINWFFRENSQKSLWMADGRRRMSAWPSPSVFPPETFRHFCG